MFNPMSSVFGAVHRGGVFVSIQRSPNPAVSNRMREDLDSATVQFSHETLVSFGVPQQLPRERRIIRIWRQHCGRVGLDYPVHEKLNRAGSYPFVVISITLFNDLLQLLLADFGRIESVCEIKTKGEFALAAQFLH